MALELSSLLAQASIRKPRRPVAEGMLSIRVCDVRPLVEVPEDLADQAAALLLEVMQDPGLEARYLRGVLPLVAEVHLGANWAETH